MNRRLPRFVVLLALGCGSASTGPDAAAPPTPDAAPPVLDAGAAGSMDAGLDLAPGAPDGNPVDADERPGQMAVSWQLAAIDSNTALTCAQADTPTVALRAVREGEAGAPAEHH